MDKDYFINDDDGYNWVSLSKPLSSYTQEELAEHLINNKKEYGTTQKIRIDGKIGGVLTTDFCETPKDFINKYQNILDRAGFKKGNSMEKVEVKEELKNKTKAHKKDAMKIIEVPFGMVNYTQEDLAHLVMDNKDINEVVGIRVKNGVILDSKNCNTVEDFINKNEKVANKLGIKHNISEKLEKIGNIEDYKYSTKINVSIPTDSIKESVNKTEPVANEVKQEEKPIVEEVKQEATLSYEENLNKLLKNREIRKAISLFSIPRGNYYNGTEANEESKLSTISEKNREYVKIFNEKENINFNNASEVSNWLNKLVPYINTHALNLNLGINVTTESADKYLLKVMEEKGYTTDISKAVSPEEKDISRKLDELKKYHFFVSDYNNLSNEDKNLNSEKTNAMADIIYFESLINDANRGLNLIGLDLATINNKSRVEKELLETQVDAIDKVLVEKGDNKFDQEITTSEERKANDAYKLASITYGVHEIEKAVSYINLLPEDSKVKEKLSAATYALFNKQEDVDLEKYPELNDRNKYLEKLDNLDENKEIVEARLKSKEKALVESINAINTKLSELHSKYQIEEKPKANSIVEENVVSTENNKEENITPKASESEPVFEEGFVPAEEVEDESIDYNLDVDKKAGIIDKLKNKFSKNVEPSIDKDYINKLESVGKIFTDEERIDPNHSYLTADNAKNLGLVDVVTEGPKEEVVSKIEMTPEDETINEIGKQLEASADEFAKSTKEEANDNNIVEFEANQSDNQLMEETDDYDLSLDDDYYDLSLPDEKDAIVDFVAIKSFRQITKELYDRINESKVKKVVKKAVDKLKETKKAACVYLGFAAVLVGAIAAGHNKNLSTASTNMNNGVTTEMDNSVSDIDLASTVTPVSMDNGIRMESQTTQESSNAVEETQSKDNEEENATQLAQEEYTVSLDDASSEAIADVLEGKNDVYRSFADAYSETNAVDSNKIYAPSWENAKGGEYFTVEDGVMNRLSKDQAEDYYKNGQDLVQSVENDGTVIGYVNIENNDSGKSM